MKFFMNVLQKFLKFPNNLVGNKNICEEDINVYSHPSTSDIYLDIQDKYSFNGDLLDIFVGNRNNIVHKWHHYIPIYDRYFSVFRNRDVRFLEIGVSKGGSLQMWRKYFGKDAIIFGVDIDQECERYDGEAGKVRIGSQTDAKFLLSVISEMGGVDVILDDGSHNMADISSSLRILFPHLNESGIYFIEDLHAAYWSRHGGGLSVDDNFFNKIRNIIDDMHRWYHKGVLHEKLISPSCSGIHIHDSIVVLEKNKVYPPVHSCVA
jgi:hypothetical protein